MVVPLYDMHLFDRVLTGRSVHTLIALSLIAAVGLALYAALVAVRGMLLAAAAEQLLARLHEPAVAFGLRRAVGGSGQAAGRALADLQELRQFFSGPAASAPFDLLLSSILLALLFLMHPLLGWFGLGSAGALVGLGLAIDALSRPCLGLAQARAEAALTAAGSVVRDRTLVEGLGLEQWVAAVWRRDHAAAQTALASALARGEGLAALARLLRALAQGGMIALAALLVVRGEATPALLVGANLMLALLLGPLDQLLAHWRSAVAARLAWLRLRALVREVAAEPECVAPDGSGIVLRDVVFRAEDGHGRAIVDAVSLIVAPGELVVLTGPNGSGKSTVLRLAAGVLAPAKGTAAVSGLQADSAAARGLVGYVPQRQQFPHGTVADTIARFHRTSAEPVVAAARAAGLHEIVGRLPRGYATWTGANDPRFSDGQRQRLALARALFGDPPALLLDEPDAGLDHEGEQLLVSALVAAKARGAAILVVTHRRPLLGVADRAVRLAGGRLVSEQRREAA